MLSLGGAGGGQSLEDKLNAVKYFISGQGLSLVVLKATTSELLGPKKKHLSYMVAMTNEPNVSIPNMVKYLMQRARHPEWPVAFKSLITIHYLISYGNEKFIQNLASSNVNHRHFDHLASFVDRNSTQAYDMSTFVRRYSRYINVKIQTYRSMGQDFCKISPKLSRQEVPSPSAIRHMPSAQLLTTLPLLQAQFDSLLEFDATTKDLNNGIINSAFSMLYKDFVKLYIIYQTAIIRLLELFFGVSQLKCAQEMVEAYRKFLVRMNKVSDFMRVIDSVGMDKSDMPNLSRSPGMALKSLEVHIDSLKSSSASLSRRASATRLQLGRNLSTERIFTGVELPKYTDSAYAKLSKRRSFIGSREHIHTPSILKSPETMRNHKRGRVNDCGETLSELREELDSDKRRRDVEVDNCDIATINQGATPNNNNNNNNLKRTPTSVAPTGRYLAVSLLESAAEQLTDAVVDSNNNNNKNHDDAADDEGPLLMDISDNQVTIGSNGHTVGSQMTRTKQPSEWVQIEL